MKNTKVIAISGASGSGKTTIVNHLAKVFDCPFLLFDDYIDECTYPTDMKQWLRNGSDVSLIKTPRLVNCLRQEISQASSRYIFVEEPFGKERDAMSPLIDYVVLLDQPMELCLMRIIKRHINFSNSTNAIAKYLNKYDDHLRDIYIGAVSKVCANADLIITEVTSITNTTNHISDWLSNIEK